MYYVTFVLLSWSILFFFKQKTAYEMRISDWSSTCALPISGERQPDEGDMRNQRARCNRCCVHGRASPVLLAAARLGRIAAPLGPPVFPLADQPDHALGEQQGADDKQRAQHEQPHFRRRPGQPGFHQVDQHAAANGAVKRAAAADRAPDRDLDGIGRREFRSEEHTSELQSLMRISYAVFCL